MTTDPTWLRQQRLTWSAEVSPEHTPDPAEVKLVAREQRPEAERHIGAVQPDTGVVHAGTEHHRVDEPGVDEVLLLVPLYSTPERKYTLMLCHCRTICCLGRALAYWESNKGV